MSQDTSPPLAPTPPAVLNFAPEAGEVTSAAYGTVFKGIALVLLMLAGAWAWQMHQWNLQQAAPQPVFWLLAPWGLMAYTVWFVVTGKTRLNGQFLEQSWMWRKRVELNNLAYAKVIRIGGLDWLIAPRLYTKSFGGKLIIFYAADATMLAEFKRLELALTVLRNNP